MHIFMLVSIRDSETHKYRVEQTSSRQTQHCGWGIVNVIKLNSGEMVLSPNPLLVKVCTGSNTRGLKMVD